MMQCVRVCVLMKNNTKKQFVQLNQVHGWPAAVLTIIHNIYILIKAVTIHVYIHVHVCELVKFCVTACPIFAGPVTNFKWLDWQKVRTFIVHIKESTEQILSSKVPCYW